MRLLAATLVTVLLLAGCGTSDEDAIAKVFQQLEEAQRSGDAEAACEEVFVIQEEGREESESEESEESESEESESEESEEEREGEEGGEPGESPEACEAAFAAGASARDELVRSLETRVESVEVEGDEAVAHVRSKVTRADGSTFSNVYDRELVRRDGVWRIRISPEG